MRIVEEGYSRKIEGLTAVVEVLDGCGRKEPRVG